MSDSRKDKVFVHPDPELRELVPQYLKTRRKDVEFFLEALEREDFEAIRAKGHDLKGSGSGYGFDAITEIGGRIEKSAKAKNPQALREQIQHLCFYLEKVEIVDGDDQ